MAAAGWAMRLAPSLLQLRNAATRPATAPLKAGLWSTPPPRCGCLSLNGAAASSYSRRQLGAVSVQSQTNASATQAALEGSGQRDGERDESHSDMPDEVVGRVMTSKANFVIVELDADVRSTVPHPSLLCNVKSLLKKMQQRVLVGDTVKVVSIDWQDGRGLVGEVIDRRSELIDPPIANVDQVLLVFAASDPPFDVTQVTRFLVATEIARIPITVVLNKCDLLPPDEVSRLVAQLQDWGYNAVPISVYGKLGLDALEETLQGRINVLAGPSGVGKSSIINFVRMKSIAQDFPEAETSDTDSSQDGEGLTQELLDSLGERVGTVGRTGRGRHTTRHTTLLTLPNGGIVADTPGFNQPALDDFNPADLASTFPEIRNRTSEHEQCTFNDCKHLQEPGCVVRGDWERYPLYQKLLEETEEKYALLVQRSVSKKARQGKIRHKSGAGGQVRAEVLLDPKKHRRSSRKQTKQKFQQDLLGDDYQEYD